LDLPVAELYEAPEAICSCTPYNDYVQGEGLAITSHAPKLIDFVKADLLFLVGARDAPQELSKDDSIEIHAAVTPLREVEALQEYLWMVYGEKVLQPCSVIVLVTDAKRY